MLSTTHSQIPADQHSQHPIDTTKAPLMAIHIPHKKYDEGTKHGDPHTASDHWLLILAVWQGNIASHQMSADHKKSAAQHNSVAHQSSADQKKSAEAPQILILTVRHDGSWILAALHIESMSSTIDIEAPHKKAEFGRPCRPLAVKARKARRAGKRGENAPCRPGDSQWSALNFLLRRQAHNL